MSKKDIDFTNVSIPADEFDAMMRRALDAPPPKEQTKEAGDHRQSRPRRTKAKAQD